MEYGIFIGFSCICRQQNDRHLFYWSEKLHFFVGGFCNRKWPNGEVLELNKLSVQHVWFVYGQFRSIVKRNYKSNHNDDLFRKFNDNVLLSVNILFFMAQSQQDNP